MQIHRSIVLSHLESSSEQVLGELMASVRLSQGYDRLRLYITNRRILVAHGSKVGAESVAPTVMFGAIGGAVGSLFRRKRGGQETKKKTLVPERILASHKDNFSIFFDEIISVDLTRDTYRNTITVLSKNDKYDFTSPSRFENVLSIFERTIGPKLRVHEHARQPGPHREE